MKKKQITKSVLAATLALSFTGVGAACGDLMGESYDDVTIISVCNMGGGVGKEWLEKAFDRFAESVADKSYEEGKQGVVIEIEHTTKYTLDDIDTAGYNIYFDQGQVNVQQFAAAGKIMNINDIVTEGSTSIESKIKENYRPAYKYNGEYYALPHYELFPGVSYDVELFDENDLYIAAPVDEKPENDGNVEPHDAFGYTVNFTVDNCGADKVYGTADDGSVRSCGNDGIYGTSDDGLPSSLVEFLALCDKIASKGWTPFALAGSHTDYSNYFLTGLTTSLSGYEAMQANFTFDGEIEVVTGYSDEPIFADLSRVGVNLPKPTTRTVNDLSEANGYLTRSQSARYYALAMLEIFESAKWFNEESYNSTTLHTTTQDKFIFSGKANNKTIAMLMELSQWTNEAQDSQSLKNFYDYTGRTEADSERNIAWMPLPTQIYDSVKEGQGRENVIIDTAACYAFINANIRFPGVVDACKDFLKFLYTDNELKEFVATTGVTRAGITLDYGDDVMNRLNSFEKSMVEMTRSSTTKIVAPIGNNETFMRNPQAFRYDTGKGAMYATVWSGVAYSAPIDVYRKEALDNVTAKDIFEQTEITSSAWVNNYYEA